MSTPEIQKIITRVQDLSDKLKQRTVYQVNDDVVVDNDNVGKPVDSRGKIIKGEGVKASPVLGYEIVIYGNDHTPTHVHVKKGTKDLGRVFLYPTVYVEDPETTSIPKGDHAKLEEHFKINKKYYQKQWNTIVGKP